MDYVVPSRSEASLGNTGEPAQKHETSIKSQPDSLVVHSISCSQNLIKGNGMCLKHFKSHCFLANSAGGTEHQQL